MQLMSLHYWERGPFRFWIAGQIRALGLREIGGGFTKHHRAPSIRSACYAIAKPSTMVQKMNNKKKLRGHRNAVYCAIFDRSGRYVITGSDDRLVKIWSMETALCLTSCRGHEGDITDLAVSSNNTLVASASNDFVIRVWCLPDGCPISVLQGHTGAVTAIAFSPRPNTNYQLLSSSDDGTCRIWDARYSQYRPRIFMPKPSDPLTGKSNGISSLGPSSSSSPQCHQILCCAYNASGTVFVTGSSDTFARVYSALKFTTDDPEQPIHELDVLSGHENDVNYVQFSGCAIPSKSSHSDFLKEENIMKSKNSWFCHNNIVTCSRDGSAIIWVPKSHRSHGKFGRWIRAYHLKVPPPPLPPQPPRGGPRQRFLPTPRGVNMIVWSLDNRFVLAAIMDCRICVWNAVDGSLVHSLTGHNASSYVLDVHPFNPRIAMSAGYDGQTIIWDIWEGTPIKIYEVGHVKLVDGKFSADGTSIVLSDDVGQIYLINTGEGESQKDAKYDQFFLGDYRPLVRDNAGHILDQETQLPPHRRNYQDPICDSSMIPYPEPYQSQYQRRRLGALKMEWKPSSVNFAVGLDIGAGMDYHLPPLPDWERVIEPLPDFIDTMLWEPENEFISEDTDSDFHVTEENSSEEERANINTSSSSAPECSADDSEVECSHKDGLRRSRRKTQKVTSSERRGKKRNLSEEDGIISGSNKIKNPKGGRKVSKRKVRAKTSRPQRVAARNARNVLSQNPGTSTDEEENDWEADSSDSEHHENKIHSQSNECDGSFQNMQDILNKDKSSPHEIHDIANSLAVPESQTNVERKRLVLKLPLRRDSKKQEVLQDSSSSRYHEAGLDKEINNSSVDGASSLAGAVNVQFSGNLMTNVFTDPGKTIEAGNPVEASFCDIDNKIRWGEVKSRTPKHARKHSDVSMDNASLKYLSQEEIGSGTLMRGNSSYMDRTSNLEIPEMSGGSGTSSSRRFFSKDKTKAEGFDGKLEENTSRINAYYDAGLNLSEAATDSARRLRTLKIKATSREPDSLSRIPKSRGGYQRTSVDAEDSSTKVCDTRLLRSRSTRNQSDQIVSSQRMLTDPVGKLSWLMLSKHEEGYRYIPQLGDEVVYLRQGHQEYMDLALKSDLGPWGPWGSLKEKIRAVEICKVISLDYDTMPGSGESCTKILFKFVESSSAVNGKTFKLTMPEIDFSDFIVEKSWYDAATGRNWAVGEHCEVWWRDSGGGGTWWQGEIVGCQAKSLEFPDSPWLTYEVRYEKEDGVPHRHCPWELHDASMSWKSPHIDHESRDKLLHYFSKSEKKDFEAIRQMNLAVQKVDFCNSFPVQLFPELIRERLKNDYYRSLEAVKHDITQMLENARHYFKRNELQARIKHLSKWFKKKVSRL
ncbi:uncharacterized protein LOC126793802 isoform X2 [Argentina anserina]|uniref:uncharacterized protein LOC126793802 isoform X2 n=1 Tax=Argentina anserina TaxID=57926 RepID=UPI00217638B7|nr:uncharacterized protein LOC126793802 isoform X2 [Potentilla anserina]